MKHGPEPSILLMVKVGKKLEGRALKKLRQVVRDYPITLTASVNGVLANFAVAFTQPTFAVFALLFTGAVLVRGRHTVTRMLVAAGVHAAHHARFLGRQRAAILAHHRCTGSTLNPREETS